MQILFCLLDAVLFNRVFQGLLWSSVLKHLEYQDDHCCLISWYTNLVLVLKRLHKLLYGVQIRANLQSVNKQGDQVLSILFYFK